MLHIICRVLGRRAGGFQGQGGAGKTLFSRSSWLKAQVPFGNRPMTSAGQLSSSKPPNVLIYQSDKDSTGKEFLRVKESLESCLTPERYVIYPLGDDDIIHHTPWKENCRLLVLPPPPPHTTERAHNSSATLSSRVIEEMLLYAQRGGRLLSMQPGVNKLLGLMSIQETLTATGIGEEVVRTYCRDEVCNVEVSHSGDGMGMEQSHRFSALVPNSRAIVDHSDSIYLDGVPLKQLVLTSDDVAFLVPLEWNADMNWLERNTNQSNNNDTDQSDKPSLSLSSLPCACKVTLTGGGQAVISSIDLLPSLPEGLSLSPLFRLKGGVAQRGHFLSELLRGLDLDCSREKLPELTHTYLLGTEKDCSLFLSAMEPHLLDSCLAGNEVTLEFLFTDYSLGTPVDDLPRPSPSQLTVITRPAQWQLQQLPFAHEEYFRHLETRELGRTVLHTPVITSTQLPFTGNLTFSQSLQQEMGVVWVAAQQTKGKGRSGNAWISPRGSMMFSTVLPLPPDSRLSQHLPLLQHIVAVAMVHGVRAREGYQTLPLRIKWPNDIYYQSYVKLGGILVSCLSLGNTTSHTAIIGCGVNVSNKYPTMSINDCIALHNRDTGANLPPLSVEQVLASTFNTLESLLTLYQVQGLQPFLQLYYHYWLHSDAVVYLASYGEERVRVVGLDKYGYLQVKRDTGEILSLQPDGNSFDIMKGLIIMKS